MRGERQSAGDRLVFLGSGGARFVVLRQIRHSGGIWLETAGARLLIDPGPGSLVRITSSRHGLDPTEIDAVLLSHRHLDHSADVNVILEAMTLGGFKTRGELFCPADALEDDPVVLKYLRGFLDRITVLREGGHYECKGVQFETPRRQDHRGETYGFRFLLPKLRVSYIADTKYSDALAEAFQADLVIINVVRLEPSEIDHLSIDDARRIITAMKPRLAVLNHFGMTIIRAKPWLVAERLAQETGINVIAAHDGLELRLDEVLAGAGRDAGEFPSAEARSSNKRQER